MPQKTGFLGLKLIPAKVRVSVEEPDLAPVPEVEAQPAAAPSSRRQSSCPRSRSPLRAARQPEPEVQAQPEEPEQLAAVQPEAELEEQPIEIDSNPKVAAAVAYLKEVIEKMGVQDCSSAPCRRGRPPIICLDGEAGRPDRPPRRDHGSLSYLAAWWQNRLEGDYIKAGPGCGWLPRQAESDLTALAQRIGKVRRTGQLCNGAHEPPTSAGSSILPSAAWRVLAVREAGEGRDRRVV